MTSVLSRREFVEKSGLLIVGFTMSRSLRFVPGEASAGALPRAANELDSWLTVAADGSVTVFSGKVELGTGVSTALRQIVAEELDVPFDRITSGAGCWASTTEPAPSASARTAM